MNKKKIIVMGTLVLACWAAAQTQGAEGYVRYADSGRYLPSGGARSLRIEAMGVTNIATEIRRVEPRNIVQLLAREEGVYNRGYWCDSADVADTAELSGACETGHLACAACGDEKGIVPLTVAMTDGGPSNGVFLVTLRHGWRCRYRLVCLSDIGLSVRKGPDGVGVWVTSLMTGRPKAEAHVEVYSTANILIATGESDANGWCVPTRCGKGTPFAVVVWTAEDMTFMALRESMSVDETYVDGGRCAYLSDGEMDAYVWTERGIYRHDERLFVHGLVRDASFKAPGAMPLVLEMVSPKGRVLMTTRVMTDGNGAVTHTGFFVPAEQPSGVWKVRLRLPGTNGVCLGEKAVKIEEFAPPQIRVRVTAGEGQNPSNFGFRVSAEHLFGGPARSLGCAGAVVFEDVPFAPAGWKGFHFGDEGRGLKPSFRRLAPRVLDDAGSCVYAAPLWASSGRPKAAVRATGEGVVFEDGGRPATARQSVICHYYPYYIGSNLTDWMKMPDAGPPEIDLVCVDPKGEVVRTGLKLTGKIERIDSVYAYRKKNGRSVWDCERVRTTVQDGIAITIGTNGCARYALPLTKSGDYVFTVEDRKTGVSFGRSFYLSPWGDDVVRAPLSDPTRVTIQADKASYRVGERPRLVVKSPFTGCAMLSVLREGCVYTEIFDLTNATSVIELRSVERTWAPNVDVAISVVQSVAASAKHLAARAHGLTTLRVRPIEHEIAVRVTSDVSKDGSRVDVSFEAGGAESAVVTLVDEGINLLTDERTANPVGWLARDRAGQHPLYDIFGRILPVMDDELGKGGVQTGGGFGAEMLGRVSPVPTRRFKPLALWQSGVAVTNGRGHVTFALPEFVGEVRITVVAYSSQATGAASVQQKVAPHLVMQSDAPRFVAPGDAFDVTLPLRNCSGADGAVDYGIACGAACSTGSVWLSKGASTNVVCRLRAPDTPGEMRIDFSSAGLGERHAVTIDLPVRPAVPWRTRADVVRLDPGETLCRRGADSGHRYAMRVASSSLAEFISALEWLADYPHGCLEQTSSRIFPLITAGGILNTIASTAATHRADYVLAGVRRVESMIRASDFVMWPDCNYAPWDREVSLYAAHFLIEAERSGQTLAPSSRAQVLKFLRTWALGTDTSVSAYACHTLALAGRPERDRMFRLYDQRANLDALSRARLARAFAATHDRPLAEALMAYAIEPQSVKEAAFRVMALCDIDPDDGRIPGLITYLMTHRQPERFCWGTTAENAHALLAIGAYYSHHPVRGGAVDVARLPSEANALVVTNRGSATAFINVREQWLDDAGSLTNEANGLFLSRRYLRSDGEVADLAHLVRGEMLVAELTLTSDVTRVVGDLVIEDLFAGAFEPVHRELSVETLVTPSGLGQVSDWVLRKDARDDRMLIYSKQFKLTKDYEAKVYYPVRVVSAGDFILPGPTVEGMYHPSLRARCVPGRLVVRP